MSELVVIYTRLNKNCFVTQLQLSRFVFEFTKTPTQLVGGSPTHAGGQWVGLGDHCPLVERVLAPNKGQRSTQPYPLTSCMCQ